MSVRGTKYGIKTRNDRLYKIWLNMKSRCTNERIPDYKDYGARGVKVCPEWLNDFAEFRNWALSSGYADDLTIDRIDVDRDYSPDNCRWATQIEQANNRRNNTRLTVDGVTKTIAEWEIATGIKQNTISCRLRRGWTAARAVGK